MPKDSSALPAFPRRVTGSLSRLGLGSERGAASSVSSSVLANAVAM
jgi:hypothetical protein